MSTVVQLPVTESIPELSTYVYRADVAEPDGTPLDQSQLSELRVTLKDVTTGTAIPGYNDVNLLGTQANITAGVLTVEFHDEDMPILSGKGFELRRLTLDFRLVSGERVNHQVQFYVQNLNDIT